ncbi:MAG TPA: hypothetical protein VJJ21_05355 [Candidatus Nanoarchaeia archaeon]|nr:hypothetical protein [Candidatus Nanoarchaeia archaeon]
MNYKSILKTIAVGALGYLPFSQAANAGEIKEHRIGQAYGLTVDQLMPMMSQESFTINVNGKQVGIPTRDFLQSLLEMNVVEAIGEQKYNNLANNAPRIMGAGGSGEKGIDGKVTGYMCDDIASANLTPVY